MSLTPLYFLAGYVVFRLAAQFLIQDSEVRRFWSTRVAVGLVAGLTFWKLTPLFTRYEAVWDNPLLLLYMNGGIAAILGGISMGAGVVSIGLWLILRQKKAHFWTLMVPVGLGAVLVLALWWTEPLWNRLEPARPEAAQWLVPTVDGKKLSMVETRGRVLVVNFWATWCPPCLAELPDLQDFARRKGSGIVLWGVDLVDTEAGAAVKVKDFVTGHKIEWPILLDEGAELQRAFGVTVVPTTLVFDADGHLVERRIGAVDLSWLLGLEARYGR